MSIEIIGTYALPPTVRLMSSNILNSSQNGKHEVTDLDSTLG